LSGRTNLSPETFEALLFTFTVHYNLNLLRAAGSRKTTIQVCRPEWIPAETLREGSLQRIAVPTQIRSSEKISKGSEEIEEDKLIKKVTMLENCSKNMSHPSSYLDLETMLTQLQYNTLPVDAHSNQEDQHRENLKEILFRFSLQKVEILQDGNCLFTAVVTQLSYCKSRMTPKYISFLRAEGLLGHKNIAQIAHTLRQNVMAFMRKTNNLYLPFLDNCSEGTFNAYVQQYARSGEFAGSFGDLLPTACADYLQSVIVLLTSDVNLQCHTVVPQKEIINDFPLYLAYTAMGCGHYDATVQTDKNDVTNIEADNQVLSKSETNSKKCRCGINSKKSETVIFFCKTSRCPCFKIGTQCQIECTCFNCKNSKAVGPKKQFSRNVTFKKLHFKHADKLNRQTGADSLAHKNVQVIGKAWSLRESLLLFHIVKDQPALKDTPTKLMLLYNNIGQKMDCVRRKTKLQIMKKLSLFKK
jgi:hypothetical protein